MGEDSHTAQVKRIGKNKNNNTSWTRWCTPVIITFGRQRLENLKFEFSLCYTLSPCLKKKPAKIPVEKPSRAWSGGLFLWR